MANIINPFGPELNDNSIRPMRVGITEKDANVATIVLMNPNMQSVESSASGGTSIDYFSNNFKNAVTTDIITRPTGVVPKLEKVGSNYFGVFKNFSIVSFAESRSEIAKININFSSSWNAYFFGSNPKVYSYSGIFLDTKDYPYYEEFLRAYDSYLAGGKCASLGYIMYMSYDTKIVVGYMLGIDTHAQADDPHMKSFSLRILVSDEAFYRKHIVRNELGVLVGSETYDLMNESLIHGYR